MITTFKTALHLNAGIYQDAVWRCVKNWCENSAYISAKMKAMIREQAQCPQQFHYEHGGGIGILQVKSLAVGRQSCWGWHFAEKEADVERIWHTFVVLSATNDEAALTFERALEGDVPKNRFERAPAHFIDIAARIGKNCPELRKVPVKVDEHSPETAALTDIIAARVPAPLPVVYASLDERGNCLFDAKDAAERLFGMAQVFIEGEGRFTYFLKRETKGANAYNGAVGIYWGLGGRFILNPGRNLSIERVYQKIVEIAAAHPFAAGLSWSELVQAVSAQKQKKAAAAFSELKAERDAALQQRDEKIAQLEERLREAKGEQEQFAKTFDAEVASVRRENDRLKTKLAESEGKNTALTEQFLQKKEMQQGFLLHVPCAEKELFPNEIDDFIKGLFYKAVTDENGAENTRKDHVLAAIKKLIGGWKFEESNAYKSYKQCEDDLSAAVKSAHGQSDIGAALKKHGFVQCGASKHQKWTYQNDPRYMATIGSTPSDDRANPNAIKDTKRMCFLTL